MHKRFENKYWGPALAFFALISLLLLAGTLRGLDFRPAQPIGGGSRAEPVKLPPIGAILASAAETPFWQQVLFWVVMFLLLVLVTSLLNPELRKQLIHAFIRTAIFVMGFFYILKKKPDILAGLLNRLSISENLAIAPQASDIPAPVFQPPQVPSWVTYAVALGLTILAALFLWWMNRLWKHIRALTSSNGPLNQIAAITRVSLKELETGRNSEDTIVQCYERMSAVVGSKQGLHRENAMTPSEFAARLERSGLPREAVSSLTHLFESVRYGGHGSGPRETTEAISCLTSILKYCGESV
ncbi:MAG TPA: DUF4129 domain-containing protein [Anaerolineales bacterium]|nr:DUF4129 domain-containing protein [Anaerolineales bacterium]